MPSATPSTGRAGRPASHQAAIPAGTMPTVAASIPTVAARSGSPAVLSRTFQATCRSALTATSAMTNGSTPGRYAGLDAVPPLQTPRADQQPADREDRRDHDADDVVRPGHRLAEVLVERQVQDGVRQIEGGAQRVEHERRDHDGRGDRCRQRRPDEAADGEADTGKPGSGDRPSDAEPATGATMSPPCDATAAITKSASTTTNTPIPAMTPSPLLIAQRARDSGVGQDEIEPAVVLVARPGGEERGARQPGHATSAKAKNASCRMPDGWLRSMSG